MELSLIAVILAVGGGAMMVGALKFTSPLSGLARPELPRLLKQRREEISQSGVLRKIEPWILFLTPRIRDYPWARALADSLAPHLKRLAYPYGFLPEEWVSLSLIVSVSGALVALFLFSSPLLWLVGGVLSGLYPYLWLRSRARAEERIILRDFPDFLDTVALLLEAGLDLPTAIERYSQAGGGTLARHLNQAVVELKAGGRLAEVLSFLEEELGIEELRGFFATVRESIRSGGSLVPVFRVQSDTLRQRRFERAEKRAMEATVKLLLPLLLIFGAVLVIVVGPLLLQLMGGF
jgi:tight adherence protein C